jgi:phospholipid/cholesterol/gamma-HCH transport system substrate-binding protein
MTRLSAARRRFSLPFMPTVAGILVVVLVAGVVVAVTRHERHASRTVTAEFSEAPGLYPGNHVEILGLPVGSVVSVTPQPGGVKVVMHVDADITVPASAHAVLVAPEVVNDRFVELTPAYTGGPAMADDAHIPLARTQIPLSVDQLLGTLNDLFTALGPTAADPKGALGTLIKDLTVQLSGQGPAIKGTITAASRAASGLADDGPALAKTLSNLSSFISTAASDAGEYTTFANDLAAVAAELDSDRSDLAGALSALSQTLGQITTFVQANGANLGSSLTNLDTLTKAVAAKQSDLVQILRLSGLTFENFDGAIDKSDPAQPKLATRIDLDGGSGALINQICGSELLRTASLEVKGTSASNLSTACLFSAAANNLTHPPGSPTTPDMSLASLIGAQG